MKLIRFVTIALLFLLVLGDCSRNTVIDQVIFITIDTLRADHLGMHGYVRNTSPFLDSLAARGVQFMKAIASSSHTAPSHATIFTSLQPAQHRVVTNGQTLDPSFLTLAEIFKSHGYQTAAFTSIKFLRGVGQGFDYFDVPVTQEMASSRHRVAKLTVDRAIAWLTDPKRSKKTFLWLHLYDVHESQPEFTTEAQQDYLRRVTAQWNGPQWIRFLIANHGYQNYVLKRPNILNIIDRYDAQISNVDAEIGRLYRAAEATRRFKNSMWVITADHGEGLGNHRYLGHGERIYQEQLHVPLVFYFPDHRYGLRKVWPLVRHVDLLPTIVGLLKWPLEGQLFPVEGYSLESLILGRKNVVQKGYAFSQRRPVDENGRADWEKGEMYCLQTSKYKYIVHTQGQIEFYDLQNDPFESRNLTGPSEEREKLKSALALMYQKFLKQAENSKNRQPAVEEEYMDELKALGYL